MRIIISFLLATSIAASAQTAARPKSLPDKPVHLSDQQRVAQLEQAVAPYIAKARKTYPAVKKRFLAGLPAKYIFSLTTKLWNRSHTRFEVVFVAVDRIKEGTVFGHVATHTVQPVGYRFGDAISFPESQVIDWTIVRPDGSEEGNAVGKFLDSYQRR
jgi:hypothetical protein